MGKLHDYYVMGNTYKHREELISWGCSYLSERKCWLVYCTGPGNMDYIALENMGLTLMIKLEEDPYE